MVNLDMATISCKQLQRLMDNSDRLRRKYNKFVTIRQLRGLDKKKQKLPASCYECHHILPTSCGGGNEPSNLVLLTFREHWAAHYLLDQFSEGDDKEKMQLALTMMSSRAKPGQLSPVAYAIGKAAMAALVAAGGHHFQSEEYSVAQSKRMTDLVTAGKHHFQTEESRAANRAALAKRNAELVAAGKHHFQTEENRAASSKRMTELAEAGLHPLLSAENRAATSKRHKELAAIGGHPSQSPSNRAAQSKRNKELVTCPHCSKTGSRGGMQRWHFDNCKHNPASKRYIAK